MISPLSLFGNPLRALESAVNDRAADLARAEDSLTHHTAALDAAREALTTCADDRRAWDKLDRTVRFETAAVERALARSNLARDALTQAQRALDDAKHEAETKAVRRRLTERRESIARNVRDLVALVEDARALAASIDVQAQLDSNDAATIGDVSCDLLGLVANAMLAANPDCALPQDRSSFWYVSPLDGTNFGRQRVALAKHGLAAIVAPNFECKPSIANRRDEQRAWLTVGVASPACASAAE